MQGIQVEIVRKVIKHLHLGVYPPHGRVRAAVPTRLDDEAVRLAIIARLGWIRRKQKGFQEQERQSERRMLTGESHYVEGRRYRLDVVEGEHQPQVFFRNNRTLRMHVQHGTTREEREQILHSWYRKRLKEQIPVLIEKWEPQIGVTVVDWRVKKMKTRWGSCNAHAGRIWLNLELAKKPPTCLEYIIVHEMIHLLEQHHNEYFQTNMDCFMPEWRTCRDLLNQAPLAHEDWSY